ncbi:hypothetical protein AB1046_09415 [Promicromonospora sp. Populi]|uniref:hypothetical protein n=1 Tax=Promicromonospora sp. Populi TaxID=3239420 RepID=UPI0034E28EEE
MHDWLCICQQHDQSCIPDRPATEDGEWSKAATIRDPFGAELVLSQFDPPEEFLKAEAEAGKD